MKFNIDKTKKGFEILSMFGPDHCDEYAGVVLVQTALHGITWTSSGVAKGESNLNLTDFDLNKINTTTVGSQHPLKLK